MFRRWSEDSRASADDSARRSCDFHDTRTEAAADTINVVSKEPQSPALIRVWFIRGQQVATRTFALEKPPARAVGIPLRQAIVLMANSWSHVLALPPFVCPRTCGACA